jgi:hypothetical protein
MGQQKAWRHVSQVLSNAILSFALSAHPHTRHPLSTGRGTIEEVKCVYRQLHHRLQTVVIASPGCHLSSVGRYMDITGKKVSLESSTSSSSLRLGQPERHQQPRVDPDAYVWGSRRRGGTSSRSCPIPSCPSPSLPTLTQDTPFPQVGADRGGEVRIPSALPPLADCCGCLVRLPTLVCRLIYGHYREESLSGILHQQLIPETWPTREASAASR